MILLVGATGVLGNLVARQLLSRGKAIRVLVRQGSTFQPLADLGAEPVFGDLKDRASLDAACRGVKTVVTTANSAGRGGVDNLQTVDLDGNRSLIDAAAAARVQQFVFVSALGADENSPAPFLQAKGRTEAYLRGSGVPFTILSPNLFMESWIGMMVGTPVQAGEPVTLVGEGLRRHSFVSVEDVAAFTVSAVDNAAAVGQQIFIGGPVAVSWREIVDATGRALGREIPVRSIAPGEQIPGLPDVVSSLAAALDRYDSPLEMEEIARTYGVRLTPVESFVRRTFSPPAG